MCQAQYEAMEYGAWINQADEATIMREIRQRVATRGWDNVRPALDLTVRAWIMHAFLLRSIPDYGTAVQLLQKVQRFLTWGEHQWPTVSAAERGVIFEPAFRRSVRRLYLHTLYQVCFGLSLTKRLLIFCIGRNQQPRTEFSFLPRRAEQHRLSNPRRRRAEPTRIGAEAYPRIHRCVLALPNRRSSHHQRILPHAACAYCYPRQPCEPKGEFQAWV